MATVVTMHSSGTIGEPKRLYSSIMERRSSLTELTEGANPRDPDPGLMGMREHETG
jgi:hypothetical protein